MSIQQQSQSVKIPFPTPSLRSKPQLFIITFDHSKIKTHKDNVWMAVEKMRKVTQEGTLYSNGRVTLDSGVTFLSFQEMKDHFEDRGDYLIENIE